MQKFFSNKYQNKAKRYLFTFTSKPFLDEEKEKYVVL